MPARKTKPIDAPPLLWIWLTADDWRLAGDACSAMGFVAVGDKLWLYADGQHVEHVQRRDGLVGIGRPAEVWHGEPVSADGTRRPGAWPGIANVLLSAGTRGAGHVGRQVVVQLAKLDGVK